MQRKVIFLLFPLLAASVQRSNAWLIGGNVGSPNKFLEFTKKAFVTSSIAFSVTFAPVSSNAEPLWTGSYSDPFHPMCKREIQVKDDGKLAVVLGEDGNPGCESGSTTKSWKLSGKVEGDSIYVDFSPKGGPKDLVGKWEDAAPQGIRWPDSNKWTRLVKEQVTS